MIKLVIHWSHEALKLILEILKVLKPWNLGIWKACNPKIPKHSNISKRSKSWDPDLMKPWNILNLETFNFLKPWNLGILKAWNPKVPKDFNISKRSRSRDPDFMKSWICLTLEIFNSWHLETMEYWKLKFLKSKNILIFRKNQARDTLIWCSLAI